MGYKRVICFALYILIKLLNVFGAKLVYTNFEKRLIGNVCEELVMANTGQQI